MDNNIIEVIVSYPTVEAEITYPTLELSTDKVVNFTDNSVRNSWGEITGDINNQADLNLALNNIDSNIAAAVALLNDAINLKEALANKGVAGGYASLNAQGKVPQSQLDIASQVNADWDSISGVSRILNKPIIPSVSGLLIGSNNLSDLGDVATARSNLELDNLVNVDNTNPANITQTSIYRFTTDTEKATWDAKQAVLGYVPQNLAEKNIPGGYAGVDGSGFIPSSLLPAYVDDVLEFANLAAFPTVGETGKIYVTLNTNKTYRWSGSAYIEIASSPGSTDSVSEGSTNLYFTENRVRNTVLTGLSFVVNSAIVAGDNILQALGKLQAQITARLIAANNLSDLTNIIEARNNLGLGTLSIQSGTFSGNSSGTNTGDETAGTIQSKLGVANTSNSGYLTSTDWNIFNNKQSTLISGTNLKTINSTSLLGNGNIILPTVAGSTGQIQFNNAGGLGADSSLFWDNTNKRLGINNSSPTAQLDITNSSIAQVPLTIRGAASQTANLQEWRNSAGSVLASVSSAGNITMGGWVTNVTGSSAINFGGSSSIFLSANNQLQIQGNANAVNFPSGISTNSIRGNVSFVYGDITFGKQAGNDTTIRSANQPLRLQSGSGFNTEINITSGSVLMGATKIQSTASTVMPLVVQGAASQTANLQEWQNSTGTVLARVLSTGDILSSGKVCFNGLSNSISRSADGGTQIMCAASYFKFVDASSNFLFGLQTDQILRISNKTVIDGKGSVYRSHISESHYSNGESYRPSTDQIAYANFSFYGADVLTNNKGSALTINNRASVYIDSFPSTNINNVYPLLGNKWSLWIADGDQYIQGGNLKIGGSANSASRLDIEANSTTDVTVVIKAIASQTAPLLEVRNSSGVSKTSITKDFELQTSAGSGAPGTTPADGAMYVDTTNHRLYVRSDGTWKYTTLI